MTSTAPSRLEQTSDDRLAVAIAGGSQEALGVVHTRHCPAMRAVARRAVVSADLAEEAVQDAFLALWRSPGRFDPARGSLRSWLQVQAHRRAIDISRSETSRHRRERQDADRDVRPSDDVERKVIEADRAQKVRAALADLHPRERRALELAYLRGHSYRQVAKLLGLPEGTVKNRIRAGLRRLRSALTH